MHLSRLRLKGFKSFGDPTVVSFETGVCAIVGPNGSGKSNIVDALAWVLGAQSPRLLRLSHMEDVIYQGSPSRPPLGRAEVVLELATDNDEETLGGLAEIALSRSVLRSGESEYRLNGETCRLSDLVELLGEANVGRSQHVLITQGEIDGLVNTKGEQIRVVIEDAAQVSPLRRRYDQTHRNLVAVDGRLSEVAVRERELKRRIRPLKAQADLYSQREDLAHRHGEIARYLARIHLLELSDRAEARERSVEIARDEIAELRSRLSGLRVSSSRIDPEALARDANSLAQKVMSLREAVTGELSVVSGEASLWRERAREWERSQRDKSRIAQSRIQLLVRIEDLETRAEALSVQRQEAARLLSEAEASVPGPPDTLTEAMSAIGAQIGRLREAQARQERQARTVKERQDRLQGYERDIDARRARVAHLTQEVRSGDEEVRAVVQELNLAQERLSQCEREWEIVDGRQRELSQDRAALLAEHDGLSAVLSWERKGGGRLLSVMDPEPGYEAALAAVVGEWADAVVFGSFAELVEAAREATESFVGTVVKETGLDSAVKGALARRVPAHLVSLVEQVKVVDSVLDALEAGQGSSFMVDTRGTLYREGLLVTHRVSSGVMERRILSIATRITAIESQLSLVDHEGAKEALSQARGALKDAQLRHDTTLTRVERLRHQLEKERLQLEGAERERDVIAEGEVTDVVTVGDLEGLLAQQSALRIQIAQAQRARDAALNEVRRIQRNEVELRLAAATLGAEVAGVRDRLRDLETQEAELFKPDGDEISSELFDELSLRESGLRELLEALNAVRGRVEGALREIARMSAELREQDKAREQERLRLTEALERAEQGLVESVGAASEARTRFLSECEAAERELERSLPEILASELPPGIAPTNAEAALLEVGRAIEQLGAVNPLAFAELSELTEELAALETGSQDVRDTSAQLRVALLEVESEMRERISRAVAETSNAFAALMGRLFLGGSGALEFEDPTDPLSSPLVLTVLVPSRRVSRLAALSGGERSLVGIAFLFAIMTVRPAPFVVLDEVEAALDEKNLAAFASLISEWGERTQLLVVTHQRRTMEVADLLLGVSMDESGVSRVLGHHLGRESPRV